MNKVEMINNKVEELMAKLDSLLKDPQVSENTKKTQKFQRTKEIRMLLLMRAFINGDELKGDMVEWFKSITTLTEERVRSQVTVNKGDNLMELLTKYQEVKDVYNKVIKAAERAGLKLNGAIFE